MLSGPVAGRRDEGSALPPRRIALRTATSLQSMSAAGEPRRHVARSETAAAAACEGAAERRAPSQRGACAQGKFLAEHWARRSRRRGRGGDRGAVLAQVERRRWRRPRRRPREWRSRTHTRALAAPPSKRRGGDGRPRLVHERGWRRPPAEPRVGSAEAARAATPRRGSSAAPGAPATAAALSPAANRLGHTGSAGSAAGMWPDTPPERAPKRASTPLAEPPSRQRTAPRPGRQRVAKREASVPRRRQEVAPGPLAGSGTRRRCCHRGGSHRKTQRRRKRVGGSEHERFVAQNETAAVAACEGGGGAASGRDGPGGSRSSGRRLAER
ncbi:hypothetical protein EMIHUDRAFT_438019 [Emiliania huxleyi CCMP1516]|uniref:Uncharacterized protein n=2 Tax=Emiliania huxleyi TaxID=2903 RepID=A0A0D3IET7_EMIH1|nr:hypothetical protein EMIHUDRAFT_438019 [Emiliania huxleyi CCMP1516]EOD09772.1 hypothetical protein EMIHUDRAFT_438019 [Emiliania huxleyi CCMP1516]|eukprot:XP_005762201.1 hypothetical protein EMIHUDRAFT_438019 [Emiliania huxleyi CCMP1516]